MEAMWGVVRSANDDRQLALLTAHPDLAGRIARAGELSPESSMEQAVAGLDQLTSTEYERFTELNAAYRKRFGFPFIICVRNHTKQEILQRFAMRLVNSRDVEMENALEEVRKIAEYRMSDLIDP